MESTVKKLLKKEFQILTLSKITKRNKKGLEILIMLHLIKSGYDEVHPDQK
jgi:hypothetical protein